MTEKAIDSGLASQLSERALRLAAGEISLGWKAGFGAPTTIAKFGLRGPLVGFMTDASVVSGTVDLSTWVNPVAEPEIAVYLGSGLGPDPTEDEARAAIAALGPAIELADIAVPPDDIEEALTRNVFHKGVVLGPSDAGRRGGDLTGLTAHITLNGSDLADTDDLEGLTGHIPFVLAHIARDLGRQGVILEAGHIVICGSIVPPIQLTGGDSVDFELRPFDPIGVEVT